MMMIKKKDTEEKIRGVYFKSCSFKFKNITNILYQDKEKNYSCEGLKPGWFHVLYIRSQTVWFTTKPDQ